MKKQTTIYILNIATVIFAILTVVSVGSFGSMPLYTSMVNTALFALLTYNCHTKEMVMRRQMKKRRHKKPQLSVYTGKTVRRAA